MQGQRSWPSLPSIKEYFNGMTLSYWIVMAKTLTFALRLSCHLWNFDQERTLIHLCIQSSASNSWMVATGRATTQLVETGGVSLAPFSFWSFHIVTQHDGECEVYLQYNIIVSRSLHHSESTEVASNSTTLVCCIEGIGSTLTLVG